MKLIRAIAFLVALSGTLISLQALQVRQTDYEGIKAEAESRYAEASYSLAHDLYVQADALTLPAAEARWVDFRVADTLWRSHAATHTPDPTVFDPAQRHLEELLRDVQRIHDSDLYTASSHESMGDS